MWALSGTFGQFLFTQRGLDAEWLTTVRLLAAGAIMLAICLIKDGKNILNIWKTRRDRIEVIIYGIVGMAGVQLTYFTAIQYSNAATGTLLQYTGSAFIVLYVAMRMKMLPRINEALAVLLAMAGIFLISTHGDVTKLVISKEALIWGLTSAILLAFYSIFPKRMLNQWGTLATNGWGMLLGGIVMTFKRSPFDLGGGTLDFGTVIATGGVVVLGTILSFFFYMESVRLIGSDKAVLYACIEPLTSAFVVMFWFHVAFGIPDWIGAFLIIGEVFLISMGNKNDVALPDEEADAVSDIKSDST